MSLVDDKALDILFREARTHSHWLEKPVPDELLQRVYDLAKMGPTSVNCSPMRIIFAVSKSAKERLLPALAAGNVEKTMSAPVTAIIGQDMEFFEKLPMLFPHTDARSWFIENESLTESTAFRNASLQGAYFMLAARALGLDCGPMSGFDNVKVDEAFFAGTNIQSNFLCNLGYGDVSKLYPRSPRLEFSAACRID